MTFQKQRMSNLTGNNKPLKKVGMKTAIITAVAASSLIFSNGPVANASASNLTTIYYVYLNDTFMGTASDKKLIKKAVEEKLNNLEESRNDINLQLSSQLKYIPEQVFRSTANNENTIENLENSLLQAQASAVIIDGKPVVYLDNQNNAAEVMKKLKLQYVTEDQLKELETRTSASQALPPLKENETRLLDVRLSKNVSLENTKVAPEKILPIDNAVAFLQKGTLEEQKYKVKDGDVLGSIANNHQLKLAELLAINPGLNENSVLKIDQEINITVPKSYLDVIVEKEVNQQEPIPYQNEVIEDPMLPKGETKVKQEGQNGLQDVTYKITEQNGVAVTKNIINQNVLKQPVNQVVIKGTKVIPSRGEGSFTWPTVGGYISSQQGVRWNKFHKGIDIARPSNRTIKAADNGVIVSAGWDGGYGNKVVIDHGNGFRTVYAHMASISVRPGQIVGKGSAIGIMGASGDATGVHLHFELYKNGQLQNPLNYVSM
ncbi:peptidoglycan DD-metalloendopeptidase family protein [Bacillota bacterium Lsc_1132]